VHFLKLTRGVRVLPFLAALFAKQVLNSKYYKDAKETIKNRRGIPKKYNNHEQSSVCTVHAIYFSSIVLLYIHW